MTKEYTSHDLKWAQSFIKNCCRLCPNDPATCGMVTCKEAHEIVNTARHTDTTARSETEVLSAAVPVHCPAKESA